MCVVVPDGWPAKLPETGMHAKLTFVFPRCLDIFSFDLYAASTTVLVWQLILLEKVTGQYRDKVWKVKGPRVVLRVAEEGRLQSIMQVIHETTDRLNFDFLI